MYLCKLQYIFNKKLIIKKNIVIEDERKIRNASENNYLKFIGKLEDVIFKRVEQAISDTENLSEFKKRILLCKK